MSAFNRTSLEDDQQETLSEASKSGVGTSIDYTNLRLPNIYEQYNQDKVFSKFILTW